jgi:hypothetical protein
MTTNNMSLLDELESATNELKIKLENALKTGNKKLVTLLKVSIASLEGEMQQLLDSSDSKEVENKIFKGNAAHEPQRSVDDVTFTVTLTREQWQWVCDEFTKWSAMWQHPLAQAKIRIGDAARAVPPPPPPTQVGDRVRCVLGDGTVISESGLVVAVDGDTAWVKWLNGDADELVPLEHLEADR